jgi:2-hydroxychromene-2-carboxylate isomerase
MPRFPIVTEAQTPEVSKQMLDAVASQIGKVPNMLRTLVDSPAALRFYLTQGQTERAQALGIFGGPTFFVGNEMFWGNDRLEDAMAFAAASRP